MKWNDFNQLLETTIQGYIVHWEVREEGLLKSNHSPDFFNKEPLIGTLEEARDKAKKLASINTTKYVNIGIYKVVNGNLFNNDEFLNKYPVWSKEEHDTKI